MCGERGSMRRCERVWYERGSMKRCVVRPWSLR